MKYILKTGQAGETQLDGLDYYYGAASRQFLSGLGLKAGMTIADIGCGVGNLACYLAEQVGPTGEVHAVDIDPAQISVAKARAQKLGLENITFHVMDAHDLSSLKETVDLAYCRWFLGHVKSPKVVLQEMANTVRQGGQLACEVGVRNTTRFYPTLSAYDQLFQLIAQLMEKNGNNVNIAYETPSAFKNLTGFSEVKEALSQRILSDEAEVQAIFERLPILLDSVTPELLAQQLATQNDVDSLKKAFHDFKVPEGSVVLLSTVLQMRARKI